jgi:hypothetical protein
MIKKIVKGKKSQQQKCANNLKQKMMQLNSKQAKHEGMRL